MLWLRALAVSVVVPLLLSSAACAPARPGPQVVSAAGQGTYAVDYPNTLTETATRIQTREQAVRATMAAYPRYPEAVKDPTKWPVVLSVYDKANEGGRSSAYVEERKNMDQARAFFTDEQRELSGKVSGAVQYAAGNCKVDAGVVSASLKDAVDKRIDKRLRDRSDAHLLIERQRATLGKENAATLEKQADGILDATYAVYVGLVEDRQRLHAMLADGDAVRRTMDEYIGAESAYQAEAGRTDAEKRASNERVQVMNKSKGSVDRALESAKAMDQKVDEELTQLTRDYEASFSALRQSVWSRTKK